ncbi:MAG: iron ABC transporter permease [Magnetococcales bacterium]|nr:iron ABC transporter permease [Magnetococcales bacterium]
MSHDPNRRRPVLLFWLFFLLAAGGFAYSVQAGSIALAWSQLFQALTGNGDPFFENLLWKLRLPRIANGFLTGGSLALSGALMQVLLHNPLADPYILGVSGGAAAVSLILIMFGLEGISLNIGAFGGAMFSMVLVFYLARGPLGRTPARMLLTGVVTAAGWGALISFLLAVSSDQNLRGMVFWLMGNVTTANSTWPVFLFLLVGLILVWPLSRSLDLLARDSQRAAGLGVAVGLVRVRVFLAASLLTAGAVMTSGTIGFVGLVTPHLLRLMGFRQHRYLLPISVLVGGTLVMVADTVARTVIAPQQLPVGVITAMVGVPLFLILLRSSRY